MAMENPAWLDAPHIQKILRNAEKDETIKVSGITVKAATAKGDNYTSDMHRVAAEFTRIEDGREIQEKRSLIVKVAPQGDKREEMIQAIGIFDTEFSMMSVTLPKMNEILSKLGTTSLGAKSFHMQHEKPTHIVIEDLAPKGFRMADRRAGLDLDHSLLAIQNLARFHAASIALKEKDSEAFSKYTMGMLDNDQHDMTRGFFTSNAKAFATEIAKWPEINLKIREKIYKLSEVLYEKGCEAAHCREGDFNVLNHGDFWVNNMLFRYDEQRKRPIDHIFVDFQISYYGSPAFDLLYFFGTSPCDDVRLHHRESLLLEYHTTLASTMIKLKCETEVLSFDKLQEELKKRAVCEIFASITIFPFVVLEKGAEIDFNAMFTVDGDGYESGHGGKLYRKIMTRLLPWYDSMGFLDV